MHEHTPKLYVFAGNNGSGKSTLRSLIADSMGISINIDPDSIARKIDPINPESKRITAGKEVIKSVKEYLSEGKDFSIETTLAGKNAIRQIQKAKKIGYEVTLIYVALNNVEQNIERVAMRVKNGGHHIATEDILRRNVTSFNHLYQYAKIADNLMLIDNSVDNGRLILEVNQGVIVYSSGNLPEWSVSIWEQFK